MKHESDDKVSRILSIYTRLKEGHTINKAKECAAYGVNPRTIQRDMADIQTFLQNQVNENGERQEIVFDRKKGGYYLETKTEGQLKPRELLAVCKVLLESRSLVKEEMFPILNKLVWICSEEEDRKHLKEYIRNEMHHYVELRHGKRIVDRLWELECAVREQSLLRVRYRKLKHREEVERTLKPVGIMFADFYYYLTAFIADIDREAAFQNPDDIFPTIYRVDRLEQVEVLDEHFSIPYAERFEEGEFRKRVQFMYGGRLQRIKFRYRGTDIDSVLDRLPTAQIVAQEDGLYTISAEVFGKGIEMWMRGQGENVEWIK